MNPRTIDTKYEGKTSTGEKAELHIPMRELWAIEVTDYYSRAQYDGKPIEEQKTLHYAVLLDAAASWVSAMPFVRSFETDKDGVESYTDKPFADGDPVTAIREHFKDANVQNDRILNSIIQQVIVANSILDAVF